MENKYCDKCGSEYLKCTCEIPGNPVGFIGAVDILSKKIDWETNEPSFSIANEPFSVLMCAAPWYDYEKIKPNWEGYDMVEVLYHVGRGGDPIIKDLNHMIIHHDMESLDVDDLIGVKIKLWRPVIVMQASQGLEQLK